MGRDVGRIVEVRGINVRAELYQLLPPYIVESGHMYIAPRINTYIKTKVGLDIIICQITGEYYDEQKRGQFTGYFLELSVKGYFESGKFVQGLRLLPMVAASIELLDADEFKHINECVDAKAFSIGTDLFDRSQEYYFSYNSIIPSHIGVFGNTGSGKSNTLARLLHEYAKELCGRENGHLLIFDINNEYGANAIWEEKEKKIYFLTTRSKAGDKIPIDYNELQEDEWCLLLNATEATQRPVIKTAFNDNREPKQYVNLIQRMILTGQHQLIRSIQYNLADFIHGIDGLKWHSKSQAFFIEQDNKKIYANEDEFRHFLEQINVEVPDENLKKFLFRLYFATAIHIGYGTQYEFISPLLRRAEKLFEDFTKIFIQNQVNDKQGNCVKRIINIVVDEAHNLLYEDDKDVKHNKITIDAFERAIKEGRKFGLYLWISSQRPSDISQTIISQMHNYFIHKLVNPYDLNRIRKAVAFLDENAMNALTVLGPGECVVSGTGVNMPCFIKVHQLAADLRPSSDNVRLFGEGGIFEN